MRKVLRQNFKCEEDIMLEEDKATVLYDINRKKIYIEGRIESDSHLLFNNAVDALKEAYFDKELAQCFLDEITVEINSAGGSINGCFLILEEMKALQEEGIVLNTGCEEFAMSAGCFLLLGSTNGKRRARKHSRCMLHRPLFSIGEETPITYESISSYKKELDSSWLPIKELIETRTNLPKAKIKLIEKGEDLNLTPEEALEYGIVTEIIPL